MPSRNSQQSKIKNEFPGPELDYEMIVFSHLRWSFVYQRPQHLISRLSRERKILFVEEPVPFEEGEENTWEVELISDNLHIFRPKVKTIPAISIPLQSFLKNQSAEIGWFYSASFSPLIGDFNFRLVIYDCMDELSLFKGAARELVDQEKFLLSECDIVFTGGKSLYESKSKIHGNVWCFPSSVDREHFERALDDIEIPDDVKYLKRPIVGYFGVIDERIDLDLLQETAILQPEVNFVMIGPLAKIEEENLPREKNLFYLGMKSYERLPNYLKAFDIAMMPFALNDATRFISPTKTLEYMAAGKPVISTAIKDVVRDYSHCVSIVGTPANFSEEIEKILNSPDKELIQEFDKILKKTSWKATAEKMNQFLQIKAE